VKPPLVEFEEGMLSGAGAGLADQTFRLMDPASHRMMAVRSDLTPQVARIAVSRLSRSARPLRLSYAGEILRVHGSELRPERQFGQVGLELIGAGGAAADAEVILLAAEALQGAGIDGGVSVDLNAPTLVASLLSAAGLAASDADRLRVALDQKDGAVVAQIGGAASTALTGLLDATGPLDEALDLLAGLPLTGAASAARDALVAVARLVRQAAPDLPLTIDPVEWRGFEYQTGTSFSLFAGGARAELGRGGRYPVGQGADGMPEEATGCTLYMDSLMRTLPRPMPPGRVYLPHGTPRQVGASLRDDGWVTIGGLATEENVDGEAARLDCSHIWRDGAPAALGRES
jgi:ATP phosphoribosyltransferase regulatory subunit